MQSRGHLRSVFWPAVRLASCSLQLDKLIANGEVSSLRVSMDMILIALNPMSPVLPWRSDSLASVSLHSALPRAPCPNVLRRREVS